MVNGISPIRFQGKVNYTSSFTSEAAVDNKAFLKGMVADFWLHYPVKSKMADDVVVEFNTVRTNLQSTQDGQTVDRAHVYVDRAGKREQETVIELPQPSLVDWIPFVEFGRRLAFLHTVYKAAKQRDKWSGDNAVILPFTAKTGS